MRSAVLAAIAFLVGFTNLVAFFCGAMLIGGDAVNGKIVAGHYFVANHGKYTEVSKNVYTYSLLHVYSLFLTMFLAMLGGAYLVLRSIGPDGRMRF